MWWLLMGSLVDRSRCVIMARFWLRVVTSRGRFAVESYFFFNLGLAHHAGANDLINSCSVSHSIFVIPICKYNF